MNQLADKKQEQLKTLFQLNKETRLYLGTALRRSLDKEAVTAILMKDKIEAQIEELVFLEQDSVQLSVVDSVINQIQTQLTDLSERVLN
ncbi:hypothetical protein A1D22_09365 [Pasteurellaceae bacterium LFhippo2]|nr:hypothetical protein [Pasteurellaceae bacterium LFhippo2]